MIKKEKEVIIKYFEILRKSHPEKFEIEEMFDEDGEPIVPENMKDRKDQNKWMLLESNVSEEDIHKLEEKFNLNVQDLCKSIEEELNSQGISFDGIDERDMEFVNSLKEFYKEALIDSNGIVHALSDISDFCEED